MRRLTALIVLAGLCISANPVFNVQNPLVSKYLNEVSYDSRDYSYSRITDYCREETDYRKDQPEGMVVHWTSASVPQELTLYSGHSVVYSKMLSPEDSSYTVYNLVPGKRYRIKVGPADGGHPRKPALNLRFVAGGQVRMIRCPGLYNVRDIGGWTNEDGKTVRYGMIYRGSEMDGVHGISASEEDISTLVNILGIKGDIDFRGDHETMGRTESPMGKSVELHRVPPVTFGSESIDDGERFAMLFRTVMGHLRKGEPVYLHCWGGADRTGCGIMCLEGLLGVTEENLIKDYEITSFSVFGTRHRDCTDGWNIPACIAGIKELPGETLADKWESFAVSTGISKKEIREFRRIMLRRR